MERMYGISYALSSMPDSDIISKEGAVRYSPEVVCYDQQDSHFLTLRFPEEFQYAPKDDTYYSSKKGCYSRLRTAARDNQERLVADYICALVLQQMREHPDDRLTFIIKDSFETEKFVGRLGYLGLPFDQISIYFVSSDIKDFLTNYLAPFSDRKISDLALLKNESNKLFGPFPQDEEMTMLRTFFWTFNHHELYPLRINLFSQFMNHAMLEQESNRIETLFSETAFTETYDADGGRGRVKTRLPKVLIECEEYIRTYLFSSDFTKWERS